MPDHQMPDHQTPDHSRSDKQKPEDPGTPELASAPKLWQRREVRFLVLFMLLLAGGFTLLSVNAVNDHFVVPFTTVVAKTSGWMLNLIGQDVNMSGTRIFGKKFAVDIKNGCNGLETIVIFVAAVLAFPAPWRARLTGLLLGLVAIQIVNLVRIVALFLTGSYLPSWFDNSHTVVWQTIVIAFGVLLWMFWANRFALPPREPA
jgi:exosortase H (IPTLxxWG-CTERM-specific)